MSCHSGPGATHHHACACREARFAEMETQVAALREAVRHMDVYNVLRRHRLYDSPAYRELAELGEPLNKALRATADTARAYEQRIRADERKRVADHLDRLDQGTAADMVRVLE